MLGGKLSYLAAVLGSHLLGAGIIYAQEPPPLPSTEETKAEVRSRAADIPFDVLQRIVSGQKTYYGFSGTVEIKSNVTPEQIAAMKQVASTSTKEDARLSQITLAIANSPYKNHRLTAAMDRIKAKRQAEIHQQWLAILKPEQLSFVYRRNREVIVKSSISGASPQAALLTNESGSIDAYLTAKDLLSVVERPAIQDRLELSEEQFTKLEDIRVSAADDALATIHKAVEVLTPPSPVAQTQTAVFERFFASTNRTLTPEQFEVFKKFTEELVRDAKDKGLQVDQKLLSPHDAPMSISTNRDPNGKVTVTLTLHNAFAEPRVIEALKLTAEQQQKLATSLEEYRQESMASMVKQQEAEIQVQTAQNQKLFDVLKSHNEKFHVQVAELLTPDQMKLLQRERLRGIGLRAIQKPVIIDELKVTVKQQEAISVALKRPAPALPAMAFTPNASPASFQRSSQEFHKKHLEYNELMRKFMEEIDQQIVDILTPEQALKFTDLTGYKFQRKSFSL